MDTPVLQTQRFVIRAFTENDLETFSQYRSRPEVAKFQSWTDFTYSDALALFKQMDYRDFAESGHWYQLAIADAGNNQLVGDIAVQFIDADQLEIGFTVAPEHQRKYVAFEAVSAFIQYAFNTLEKHRVIATTDTLNIASFRLLESLGFRREAHFRQNIYFKGAWGDEYQYALLKSEGLKKSRGQIT